MHKQKGSLGCLFVYATYINYNAINQIESLLISNGR